MSKARINQMKRRKRMQTLCRRLTFAISTLFLILVLAVAGFRMNATAVSEPADIDTIYFKSIQISQGDSLWSIAKTNMDDHYDSVNEYVNHIAQVNDISKYTLLTSGEYIILPYYK